MTSADEPSLRARLEALGSWVERFEDARFSAGAWAAARAREDGSFDAPYYEYSPEVDAFRVDCARFGWVVPFDWMTWAQTPEGRRLIDDREALAAATPDDLQHLLTAIVRSDRFSEGSIAGAIESGLVLAVARRARQLAEADAPEQ